MYNIYRYIHCIIILKYTHANTNIANTKRIAYSNYIKYFLFSLEERFLSCCCWPVGPLGDAPTRTGDSVASSRGSRPPALSWGHVAISRVGIAYDVFLRGFVLHLEGKKSTNFLFQNFLNYPVDGKLYCEGTVWQTLKISLETSVPLDMQPSFLPCV